jgi:hypothetical protein
MIRIEQPDFFLPPPPLAATMSASFTHESSPFHQVQLDLDKHLFATLSQQPHVFSVEGKGRKGGILVACRREDQAVPVIRSTTAYPCAPLPFATAHHALAAAIEEALPTVTQHPFNNAMIELYTHEYRTMGFHTDQALDLAEGSTICLFSCYANPTTKHTRTLVVRHKMSGAETRIPMNHNSVIAFDTHANRQHTHKIILEKTPSNPADALWLGVTFRTSKTWVTQAESLRPANAEETKQFMIWKGQENKQVDWVYPSERIAWTLSPGDL